MWLKLHKDLLYKGKIWSTISNCIETWMWNRTLDKFTENDNGFWTVVLSVNINNWLQGWGKEYRGA